MSLNQNIRYKYPGPYYNPQGLYDYVKPSRILTGPDNPDDGPNGTGEDKDYYINTTTGDLFENDKGTWNFKYNFDTGGGGGGITNIENESSPGLFKNIIGSTAHFKGLGGTTDQIYIDGADPDTVILGIEPTYKPETLGRVNNFPLETGLGSITFDPNGVIGEDQGYNLGSLAVQVPNIIWICQDPVGKVWSKYADDEGVASIQNVGLGAGAVFKNTVGGVSSLRTMVGEFEEVTLATIGDEILIGMSPNYKPITLSLVENVKQGYGEPSAPTTGDDATQGYIKGALYSEVEPAGAVKLWVCKDPAPGAAVWGEVSGGGTTTQKDYISWAGQGGQPQSIPNNDYTDVNFDGPGGYAVYAIAPGSKWSSLNDGTRRVFRRDPVSEPKAYRVSLNMVLTCTSPSTQEMRYLFRMIKKTGTTVISQSLSASIFPISTEVPRRGNLAYSFIYYEPLTTVEDYYFQIRGRKADASPADNIFIDNWSLSINEL